MQIRQTTQTCIHRSPIDTWVGFFLILKSQDLKTSKSWGLQPKNSFHLGLYENILVVYDKELICLRGEKANCRFFSFYPRYSC